MRAEWLSLLLSQVCFLAPPVLQKLLRCVLMERAVFLWIAARFWAVVLQLVMLLLMTHACQESLGRLAWTSLLA
jgi:hypothetical protein